MSGYDSSAPLRRSNRSVSLRPRLLTLRFMNDCRPRSFWLRIVLGSACLAFVLPALAPSPRSIAFADANDDFNVALQLYKNKRFEIAADSFADFVKKNPTHDRRPLADLYLGQSLMQLRKFKEALVSFEEFLAANPDHQDRPLALYRSGECRYFLNDVKDAAGAFEDFLAKYPDHELAVWAWYYLGESRLRQGEAASAVESFKTVVSKYPDHSLAPEAKFGLAKSYQALGESPKAVETYSAIAADEKNHRAADALFNLASLQFDAGNFADSARSFESFRKRYPDNRQAHVADMNAGAAYYKLNEFNRAIEAFQKAAESPGEELAAQLWIGRSRKALSQFDEAVTVLKAAAEKFDSAPGVDAVLFDWADSELRAGRPEVALPLFLQVVDRFPTSEFADNSLQFAVDCALRADKLDEAEQLHRRFAADYPNSGLAMLESLLYGRILLAKAAVISPKPPLSNDAANLVQTAALSFSKVLQDSKIEGTQDWARLLLGRSQQMQGLNAEVIETLKPLNERLVQKKASADLAESLFLTGKAAAQLQKWPDAEQAFQSFVDLKPTGSDSAAALTQLAVLKVETGKEADLPELWNQFEKAGAPAKSLADAIHAAAESNFDRKKWSEAAVLFARLDAISGVAGYHAIALSGLGHCEYEQKHYQEAIAAFSKLIDTAGGDDPHLTADAIFMKGLALDAASDIKGAAEAYLAGAKKLAATKGGAANDPEIAWNTYRCWRGAARASIRLEDVDSADASYAEAWKVLQELSDARKADSDKLLNEWATVNLQARRYERSDELFQKLVDEYPASEWKDNARQFLAESLLDEKKYDEAEAAFKELLADPASDVAVREASQAMLIELAARKQDWPAAAAAARALLADNPRAPQGLTALYRLGEASLRTNEFNRAKTVLGELRDAIIAGVDVRLPAFEWNEGVWLLLAEANFQLKDYPVVDQLLKEFRDRFPESKLTYQADELLGRSLIRRSEFDQAREALQKAVDSTDGAKTETAANAQFEIGEAWLAQKAYADALREYYKVVLAYDFPEIQARAAFQAGQCQESLNNGNGAVMTYKELVEKFPNSEFATRAKERLAALKDIAQ
jgi:TolA-binding protein